MRRDVQRHRSEEHLMDTATAEDADHRQRNTFAGPHQGHSRIAPGERRRDLQTRLLIADHARDSVQ
jgi:hypothetical protein